MVEGGATEKPGKEDGGIFKTSEGDGSHGWPSLPFILGALPSPSGSGDAFLFTGRVCFPLSVKEEDGKEGLTITKQYTQTWYHAVLKRNKHRKFHSTFDYEDAAIILLLSCAER